MTSVQLTLSLDELAEDIRETWAETKAHQVAAWEGYFRVGADLLEARRRFSSDKLYGQWFARQKFEFTTQWAGRLARLAAREGEARGLLESGLSSSVDEIVGLLRAGDHEEKRQAVLARIASEPAPLPTGPFRVIVADPPWRYDSTYDPKGRRVANPYPDMSLEEITALDVRGLAHDDAILWLWTTNTFLEHSFGIARAWGFEPKTILTWAKDRMGVGDWLRGQTEHCLMAARGKPTVTLTNQTTLLHGPLREHSRKPDEFYALVEALCPGSRVELFAREPRDGWTAWGAEADAA